MNEFFYYIQHAVFGGSEKISIAHIVPVFLPIIGALVLWGVFAYYRGQKIKIITALMIYIVLTMIIPLSIYIYSAFYLSSSPYMDDTCSVYYVSRWYAFTTIYFFNVILIKPMMITLLQKQE